MKSLRLGPRFERMLELPDQFGGRIGLCFHERHFKLFCLQDFSLLRIRSLPIPSRDEILNSPAHEHGPVHGGTSNYTAPNRRAPSPVMDDPSEELERELAGTHLASKK